MSSPRVYHPPLGRKVLPWFFVLAFLITAPLVIFYTSGYRYNVKKGIIERNGTLIVDAMPAGSAVFIDGQPSKEVTPITFQDMVPGWHTIKITKQNYLPWEQTVLIRPERVTFANHVWLWREVMPHLVLTEPIASITSDPLREKASLILASASSSPALAFWAPGQRMVISGGLTGATILPGMLRWRDDGQAILVNGLNITSPSWWSLANQKSIKPTQLSPALYHWSDSGLIGNDGSRVTHTDPERRLSTITPLKTNEVAKSTNMQLETASSTKDLMLADHSFLTRLFALPRGAWNFADIERPYVLLKNQDAWLTAVGREPMWLAVELKFGTPYAETVHGDFPRWLPQAKTPTALFVNQNELWSFVMGQTPTLLWRQSEPIVQAAWHRSGDAVFIANQQSIFALTIASAQPTVTPLTTFDRVYDMTILGKTLYVAAEKDGTRGLWSLQAE